MDQNQKVISRHLFSATEDTHRIGLQETGQDWEFHGAENGTGYLSSSSEGCALSAQQSYSSYQYASHVTMLLTPPQQYLVSETRYRSWPDILSMSCQTSRLDILSLYLAIYGPVDCGGGTVRKFESIDGHDIRKPQP